MGQVDGVGRIVEGTGRPIALREFRPRQFAYGVKAKVYGKQTRFPGLFINAGTPKGSPADDGHVLQNTRGFNPSSGRYNRPARQYGPAVPTEMVKNEAERAFRNAVATMLPKRLDHEIGRLLG